MSDLISPDISQSAGNILVELHLLVQAQRATQVATLAAAVVAAMGRPVSVGEVLTIQSDLSFSLYADRNNGRYQDWAKTKDERLAKVQT